MHTNISIISFTIVLFACTTRSTPRYDSRSKVDFTITEPRAIIRNIDTNIQTTLYSKIELQNLNITGKPFTITDNLVIYQKDSSLYFIPIDTGVAFIKSWQPKSNDTFLKARIYISADSYLLAIRRMVV